MRLEDALIALGENYASYVLESIGSRFTVDTLPNTFEEFKDMGGLEDPLWYYITNILLSEPSLLMSGRDSIKKEHFSEEDFSLLKEGLNKCVDTLPENGSLGKLRKKISSFLKNPDGKEKPSIISLLRQCKSFFSYDLNLKILRVFDLFSASSGNICVSKECSSPAISKDKVSSGFPLSTYDEENRLELSASHFCFKHFVFLLLEESFMLFMKGLNNNFVSGRRKGAFSFEKGVYYTLLSREPVMLVSLYTNLSLFLKDYYISRKTRPSALVLNQPFILIHTKKENKRTMRVLGLYPLLFLEKLSTKIVKFKKYSIIIDSLWETLFNEDFLGSSGGIVLSEFGSLFVNGFLSDRFIFGINTFQRDILNEEKISDRILARNIGKWYNIVNLFTEEVIRMGDKTFSPQHLGFKLGSAIVEFSIQEEGKKDLSQVRKLVRSYSHMMEVSEGEFLKKLNDLFRRVETVPFNTSYIPEIAKNRRYRLLFVNGLLAGVGSNTKGDEEKASVSSEKLSEPAQEVMANE